MKATLILTLLILPLIATSGQQQEPIRELAPPGFDSLMAVIDRKTDSVAMVAAHVIDSMYEKPKYITRYVDVIPDTTGTVYMYAWRYKVFRGDTSFHKVIITKIKP